ncbi:MAG TPA: type IV pilus twitching motility protein PilT [Thermoanaerobaculia bacterium]|nr:type IV pilus twitching motility protein PilT [Thermoanaerobaculia bacterium]
MSLENLLRQAAKSGARELRLITGKKIVIATPNGEEEIGPEATSAMIQQYVAPVMPPAARQAIATGPAEWVMKHAELGDIRAVARVEGQTLRASFFLDGADGAAAAAAPGAAETAAPRVTTGSGPTAEMDSLFTQMFEMKASDLHMCVGTPPLVRHDGEMKPLPGRDVLTAESIERILMPIAPERNRQEFRDHHDTDFAYEIKGLSRFRCNFFMDRKGMGAVFRVIPSKIITAEDMGLSKEILDLCFLSKGLVLVTGPTGSGKSTTLCALIDYINRNRTDHIITIEDPIEFVHENKKCLINQRQVGEHTDTFKSALRAALREDPDIVLVGEMRDLETVSIAIETAETGHLVFGTLHTSSAASTVDRIIDQFPADRQDQIRVMLASSLKGVISQMLCRKIGGGRVPALEVMFGISSISNLIREAKIFQIPSIMQTGKKVGMCLMNDSMLDLVKKKVVEPQEAYAKAVDKVGLLSMFKSNQIDVSWYRPEAGPAA